MNLIQKQLYQFAGFLSENYWGRLSGSFQLATSALIARFYNTRFSRFMIKPYCWWQYGTTRYLDQFFPGSGESNYKSFQDFFTRNFKVPPVIAAESVWPCEGYLCEAGRVQDLSHVRVKGHVRRLHTIFGAGADHIPDHSYFSNVFLHNNNYHHIHAPVDGVITRVEHIPGELLLLRPWAYKDRPSLPALTNERINVDIRDAKGRSWFLSIVGGPLVATIELLEQTCVGAEVVIGQKIASFALGSTCCMVSPEPVGAPVGTMVAMGDPLHDGVRRETSSSQAA